MNNKGQTIFVSLMMGILFFILGLALASPMTEITDDAQNQTAIDCSNASITDQNKAVCTQIDTMTPLYIGLLFGFAGLILGRAIT